MTIAVEVCGEWLCHLLSGRVLKSPRDDNLKRICETHLQGVYTIQMIHLMQQPALASGDKIIAVPTLVRHLPTPVKKIICDLSNTERVLVGLDLRPAGASGVVSR